MPDTNAATMRTPRQIYRDARRAIRGRDASALDIATARNPVAAWAAWQAEFAILGDRAAAAKRHAEEKANGR